MIFYAIIMLYRNNLVTVSWCGHSSITLNPYVIESVIAYFRDKGGCVTNILLRVTSYNSCRVSTFFNLIILNTLLIYYYVYLSISTMLVYSYLIKGVK